MNANLKSLLEKIVEMDGNNDLMEETTIAASLLLEGKYEGHNEDVEALEDKNIITGFDLEAVLSQGEWYFQIKKEYIYNVGYGWNIETCKMCSFTNAKGKTLAVENHSTGNPNYRILRRCGNGGCVKEGAIDKLGVSFCECESVEAIDEKTFTSYKKYNQFE